MTVVCFERDLSAVAFRLPRSFFSLEESANMVNEWNGAVSRFSFQICTHTAVCCVPVLVQCLLTDHSDFLLCLLELSFEGRGDSRLSGARLTA